MAEMCLDVGIALVGVPVNIAALIDDTDFKTQEITIAYNQAGMVLVWNFITTAGVFTQTAVTPTTSGDYDWAHKGNAMYTIEMPASGGASINNNAEGSGWFSGYCTGVLPWSGPVICFRAAGLNNLLIDSAYSTTRGLSGTALDAAITTRSSHTAVAVWSVGTRTLTSFGTLVADIWNRLTSVLTTTNSIGKLLVDNINATISSRANENPPSQVLNDYKATVTNLDVAVSTRSSHTATDVWVVSTRTLTSFGTLVADIWNRLTSALTITGSIGKLLVDNINATISSRANENPPSQTLNDYKANVTNLDVAISSRSNHTPANVQTEIEQAGSHLTLIKDVTDKIDDTVELDTGLYEFTAKALNQAPSGTGGDATAANQATIMNRLIAYFQLALRKDAAINADNATELIEINADEGSGAGDYDNQTDSQEAIIDTGNSDWITGSGLSGSNAVTINIKDQSSNNVVECAVEIWDEANTTFYERKTTDSNGDTTHSIDDGTYTVRIHKAGYTFINQTLVVTIAETKNYTGTTIQIGIPPDANACRVYDYAFKNDGVTPVPILTASCFIYSLPYDYSGKLHSGEVEDCIYNVATGLFYFDLVRGASIKFNVKHFGYINKKKVIPDLDQIRLKLIVD